MVLKIIGIMVAVNLGLSAAKAALDKLVDSNDYFKAKEFDNKLHKYITTAVSWLGTAISYLSANFTTKKNG